MCITRSDIPTDLLQNNVVIGTKRNEVQNVIRSTIFNGYDMVVMAMQKQREWAQKTLPPLRICDEPAEV